MYVYCEGAQRPGGPAAGRQQNVLVWGGAAQHGALWSRKRNAAGARGALDGVLAGVRTGVVVDCIITRSAIRL